MTDPMFPVDSQRVIGLGLPRISRAFIPVIGPVLVVFAALSLLVASRLESYHGNPAGFVLFGKAFVQYTHPPIGAPLETPFGYDGQFYWIEARDPLLLHRATFTSMGGPGAGYHFQRPAYPGLAYALALGHRAALPWTMLAVNLLAILAVTAAFAAYCRRRGWSSWWALGIGLMPGLLMPALRDLTDPLAIAAAVGGVLAWYSDRRWLAAVLLTVSVLSREPMYVVAAGIAVESAATCWRSRREPGAVRRILGRAWPPVVVPAIGYFAWQIYIHLQAPVTAPGAAKVGATSVPLFSTVFDVVHRLTVLLGGPSIVVSVWEAVYIVLIVLGAAAALFITRRAAATGVAAAVFAALLLVVDIPDQWSLTRYGAPLFAMLLIAGLEEQSRVAQRVCVAGTAMTLFLPSLIAAI